MTIWTVISATSYNGTLTGCRSFKKFEDAGEFKWKCQRFEDEHQKQAICGPSPNDERIRDERLKRRVANHPMGGDAGYFRNEYAIKQNELV